MCIIISKPKNKNIPAEHITNSHANNKDGVGIMYAGDGRVIIEKWLNEDHDKFVKRLSELDDRNVVIHYRAASVGEVSLANIHPFWVFEDKLAMCHNGTIFNAKPLVKNDESDSAAFARLLSDFPEDFLQREGLVMMMTNYIGTQSRLAFLDSNGSVAIVNKKLGEEVDGIWYSNKYYTSPTLRGGCSVEFPTTSKSYYRNTSKPKSTATIAKSNDSFGGLFDTDNRRGALEIKYQSIDKARLKEDDSKVYSFVYGTLKSGYGNNRCMGDEKTSQLVDTAVTIDRLPCIGKNMGFPYMLDLPGQGKNVKGELWVTTVKNLTSSLDSLEGYPHHYVRRVIDVATRTGTFHAVCYFKRDVSRNDLKEEFLDEWNGRQKSLTREPIKDSMIIDSIEDYWDTPDYPYYCEDCGAPLAEGDLSASGLCCYCLSDNVVDVSDDEGEHYVCTSCESVFQEDEMYEDGYCPHCFSDEVGVI